MNEIGAYDDISMTGLNPSWYSSVPIGVQTDLMRAYPNFRILFNPVIQQYVVVVKDEAVRQKFAEGWLVGWSIATHFPGRLVADQVIAYLRSNDRWNDEFLDRWAPKGDGPPGETVRERVVRAEDNMIDANHAARDAMSDAENAAVIDDFLPNGKMIFGPDGSRGSQNAGDWWKKEDAKLRDAESRAHSSGKRRPWHGLAHLRNPDA